MVPTSDETGKPMRLPIDLLISKESPRLDEVSEGQVLQVLVPDEYEDLVRQSQGWSEVLAIQQLLSVARRYKKLAIHWQPLIAKKAFGSPPIFPLLAVLLVLRNADHFRVNESADALDLLETDTARHVLYAHVLSKGFFADSQIILCADSLGKSTPPDLYDPRTRRLRSREDIETVVLDVLAGQQYRPALELGFSKPKALAVIVSELFENTHLHARLDLERRPIGPNSVRGLLIKRTTMRLQPEKAWPTVKEPRNVAALELSIFDSGVGLFSSFTRQPLDKAVDLKHEWRVLHNCLERHYNPDLPDLRSTHRGMGLDEVIRALQMLRGSLEIRTGRLFAYRTFVEGELQPQMLPSTAEWAQRVWPKPVLLDSSKRYVAQPTEHEQLVGASIRVLVPME